MKYTTLIAIAALVSGTSAHRLTTAFAPPADGPYASDTDHLSTECYGADEDDIMYDVFERYRVEEKNPMGASTGIWKLPKASGPQWAADIIRRFHVMKEDKIDEYVAANFDNFWKKYDNKEPARSTSLRPRPSSELSWVQTTDSDLLKVPFPTWTLPPRESRTSSPPPQPSPHSPIDTRSLHHQPTTATQSATHPPHHRERAMLSLQIERGKG